MGINSKETKGKELVGQGRVLAHISRKSLLNKKSKLKAGKESAKRLIAGTKMQNKAKKARQTSDKANK